MAPRMCSCGTASSSGTWSLAVEVAPIAEVAAGESLPFRAIARTADGRGVADQPISWWSSNPSVATVTETGLRLARKAGTTRITAQSDGVQTQIALTIVSAPWPSARADRPRRDLRGTKHIGRRHIAVHHGAHPRATPPREQDPLRLGGRDHGR